MGPDTETPLHFREETSDRKCAAFSTMSEAESVEELGHKIQMGGPILGRTPQVQEPALATRLLKDSPKVLRATVTQLVKDCTTGSMSVT
jgi:hypothetical protein